jgi:hypothetical protein
LVDWLSGTAQFAKNRSMGQVTNFPIRIVEKSFRSSGAYS